jgi:predicted  nucleic acid-binding Zn-ribbon protein
MPTNGKPLGQAYYEEVEALKSEGLSNADAIREVAKKYSKKENAIRGGIHQYRMRHLEGSAKTTSRPRGRRSVITVNDAVAEARNLLEQALSTIDDEVARAKQELEAAEERYEAIASSAEQRKQELEKKIKALS